LTSSIRAQRSVASNEIVKAGIGWIRGGFKLIAISFGLSSFIFPRSRLTFGFVNSIKLLLKCSLGPAEQTYWQTTEEAGKAQARRGRTRRQEEGHP
jgi:hypothetical protein